MEATSSGVRAMDRAAEAWGRRPDEAGCSGSEGGSRLDEGLMETPCAPHPRWRLSGLSISSVGRLGNQAETRGAMGACSGPPADWHRRGEGGSPMPQGAPLAGRLGRRGAAQRYHHLAGNGPLGRRGKVLVHGEDAAQLLLGLSLDLT